MSNGVTFVDDNVQLYRDESTDELKYKNAGGKPFMPETNNNLDLGGINNRWKTIYGVATSAQYADLAEKYSVDGEVSAGDVVCISEGDEFDCELSGEVACERVLGVVSINPAFRMNEGLEDAPFIALRGRVPCKVNGPVKKGDCLVSYLNGAAISKSEIVGQVSALAVFAKALETNLTLGLVEIEVVVL